MQLGVGITLLDNISVWVYTWGMNRYSCIEPSEALEIINKCSFELVSEKIIDGENMYAYSTGQRFGATDYQDHRRDTVEQLKSKVWNNITGHGYQRLHYYTDYECTKPFSKVVLSGYLGGYTAYFIV